MDPCRFGNSCWCTLWALLAKQEGDAKHIADVPEPQIMEEILKVSAKDTLQERISERVHEQTVDQPGDQACRDPADSMRRQGCRYACGDATTSPSDSDGDEDRGGPAGAVRRQGLGGACDHADVPTPHVALQERILERVHKQIVHVPVPKTVEEPVVLQFQEGNC